MRTEVLRASTVSSIRLLSIDQQINLDLGHVRSVRTVRTQQSTLIGNCHPEGKLSHASR